MSVYRSIKVTQKVYQALRDKQLLRETYSDTIWRMLTLADLLEKAIPLMHREQKVLEQKADELEKLA
jgi:hypothetical protein